MIRLENMNHMQTHVSKNRNKFDLQSTCLLIVLYQSFFFTKSSMMDRSFIDNIVEYCPCGKQRSQKERYSIIDYFIGIVVVLNDLSFLILILYIQQMRPNFHVEGTSFQQFTLNNYITRTIEPIQPLQNNSNSSNISQIHNETLNYKLDHSAISKSKSKLSHNQHNKHHKAYYHRQIERVLMNQNANLKEHNEFLVKEIKALYQRQSKMKKKIKKYEKDVLTLQDLNIKLQNQLHLIVNIVTQQIQRIQHLLNKDKNNLSARLNHQQQLPQTNRENNNINYKQIGHRYIQNLSTSFFAYSQPSQLDQSKDCDQSLITNRLIGIKAKINKLMNKSRETDQLKQVYQQQLNKQMKQRQKEQKYAKNMMRYQIVSTNTNSEYVHQLPLELIKNKKQH